MRKFVALTAKVVPARLGLARASPVPRMAAVRPAHVAPLEVDGGREKAPPGEVDRQQRRRPDRVADCLASDASAARAHPFAPFAPLFFLAGDIDVHAVGHGHGHGREPAPAAAVAAAELLEAAARVCARVRRVRGGAGGGGAGAAAARERFLAVAALGGWAGLEFEAAAPAPRRPRDCALGLLFAAFHTERWFAIGLYGDALGARIAREAARL
eukprot:tig00021521_g22079.t1